MNQPNNIFNLPTGGEPPKSEPPSQEENSATGLRLIPWNLRTPEIKQGAPVAPWPLIDRFPTIVGSSLSLSYLSAAYRLALTGYRREYVDALSELIERDPHLYAVLMQRVLTACGARIVVLPRDAASKRCRKIAADVQNIIDGISGFRQALATIVFSGLYYGIGACEINWEPKPRKGRTGPPIGWIPKSLDFVHSRRLNYPDPGSWDLRIWDQGQVFSDSSMNNAPTSRLFGVRVADYPGKFVVFSPQLHADYPTREGVGRIVAFWSALKTMGARGAAQYVERYAKPWAIASYTTTSTGIPRAAEASAANNDVGAAMAALTALGTGSLAGAVVPDSVKIALQQITGSRSNIGHKDWNAICNAEMSKGVLGQTDTTDGSASGSRARASVMKTGSNQIARLDVMLIADCFQQGLVDWIVKLNWPADYDRRPYLSLAVDPEPDPYGVVKLATMFAQGGAPVDADEIARTIGVRLVNPGDTKARAMVPVKPMDPMLLHPDLFTQPGEGSPPGEKPPSGDEPGGDGTEDDPEHQDDEQDKEDDEEDGDKENE